MLGCRRTEVFLTCPTWRSSRGRPRTHWGCFGSPLAWEHPKKSWPGRVDSGDPMYEVWVGLELQLQLHYGIKTSPSSSSCWPKSPQYNNSAVNHSETLFKTHHRPCFGIKRQRRKLQLSSQQWRESTISDIMKLKTFALNASKKKKINSVCTRHSTSVRSYKLLFVISH